jgi:hypothetical protein
MVRQKFGIPVGTRFKLSKLGEARNPRVKNMEGTIVGESQYKSSLRVVVPHPYRAGVVLWRRGVRWVIYIDSSLPGR